MILLALIALVRERVQHPAQRIRIPQQRRRGARLRVNLSVPQQAQQILAHMRKRFDPSQPQTPAGPFQAVNHAKHRVERVRSALALFERQNLAVKLIEPLRALHHEVLNQLGLQIG